MKDLGVERSGPVGLNTRQLQQPPPGVRSEDRIPIAHQRIGETMSPNHMLEEERGHVRGSHRFCGRDEQR